ncbi:class I SAM-dependent methyltransferase [Patescibacteria group bacterium]|nr:MAG: class I SAM-dependent methyltransferase [Patescibacteria group bacterium]
MTHHDLVQLIAKGIPRNGGGVWADFGSGTGAFTLALRDIAGPDTQIYSIDKDRGRLREQEENFDQMYPDSRVSYISQDFTNPLDLPPLDGLIAANSIHFYKDHVAVFRKLAAYLKPGGTFIVVEYNADRGNIYVPHPFSIETFKKIATEAGLQKPKLLTTTPSGMLDEMYTARAIK